MVHITGALRKEEMDDIQAVGIKSLGPHEDARLLVMVGANSAAGWG